MESEVEVIVAPLPRASEPVAARPEDAADESPPANGCPRRYYLSRRGLFRRR